jgi:hypothetical protein
MYLCSAGTCLNGNFSGPVNSVRRKLNFSLSLGTEFVHVLQAVLTMGMNTRGWVEGWSSLHWQKESISQSHRPSPCTSELLLQVTAVDFNATDYQMKSTICDITPCSLLSLNRSFGGTYRLHRQGRKNKLSKKPEFFPPAITLVSCSVYFWTLKMEAIYSSETSVDTERTTRYYIPEDATLHNHRCENLKSYRLSNVTRLNASNVP